MERAQKKLKLSKRPMTSGYRHTFATDALENGVPDAHVAYIRALLNQYDPPPLQPPRDSGQGADGGFEPGEKNGIGPATG